VNTSRKPGEHDEEDWYQNVFAKSLLKEQKRRELDVEYNMKARKQLAQVIMNSLSPPPQKTEKEVLLVHFLNSMSTLICTHTHTHTHTCQVSVLMWLSYMFVLSRRMTYYLVRVLQFKQKKESYHRKVQLVYP